MLLIKSLYIHCTNFLQTPNQLRILFVSVRSWLGVSKDFEATNNDSKQKSGLHSTTKAHLKSVSPMGYDEDRELDAKVMEYLHISECFEHANDFDIIHNQFYFLPLTYSGLTKTPVVTTIHGFSPSCIMPVYKKYNKWCKLFFG